MMGVRQVPAGRPANRLLTDSQVARAPYRKQRVCGEPFTAWAAAAATEPVGVLGSPSTHQSGGTASGDPE